MKEHLRKILNEYRYQLVTELDIEHGLLNELVSRNVIADRHLETIKCKPTRGERVEALLDILKMGDDSYYNLFRDAVKGSQPHLVDKCIPLNAVSEFGN